ncbi:MAG: transporter ATP-binding protein [Actinotalea sp.]|nr:transporter ATP-binding protein [Actinotalea sp.]
MTNATGHGTGLAPGVDGGAVALSIKDVGVTFTLNDGKRLEVLKHIDVTLPRGSFSALLGPSGCGKSTLLNVIAGVLAPSTGTVTAHAAGGGRAEFAYVFQSSRLMPWLTVEQNIEFALKARRIPRDQWSAIVGENLELVGLTKVRKEYPLRLSGGMQQRVGIARALAVQPDLLLMDEPFSHLDEISAKRLRSETARICHERGVTALLVTHDLLEAVFMAQDVYIMGGSPGGIVGRRTIELDYPRSYADPAVYELQGAIATHYYGLLGE